MIGNDAPKCKTEKHSEDAWCTAEERLGHGQTEMDDGKLLSVVSVQHVGVSSSKL